MMTRYWALVGPEGEPIGFFPGDIYPADGDALHPSIPAGAVEITPEQYEVFAEDQNHRLIDGELIGVPVPEGVEFPIEDASTAMQAQLDALQRRLDKLLKDLGA